MRSLLKYLSIFASSTVGFVGSKFAPNFSRYDFAPDKSLSID